MQKVIIEKQVLEELWCEKELSINKISKLLNIGVKTIRKNIKEHNLVQTPKNYTTKEWLYQKHYVEKLNCNQIAKIAGVNSAVIRLWMSRNDLKVDKEISINSKKKYQENVHYFDVIDTEEKAYWLGFLMADGCIRTTVLYIRLSRRDKKHIRKFLNTISSNREITDYETELNGKMHKMSRVDVASYHMVGKLRSYGFVENKSMNEVLPELPKELLRHFIRGYFDGDGCFSYGITKNDDEFRYVGILGGKSYLEQLKEIINKENIICNVYRKQGELHNLMIHHNQALAFLDYI